MIGWINLSVEAFICDSFGRDAWLQIIKQAHVDCNWVSSCPYPDKITYDLVITGAGILGVTVPQALEAYGLYFVNYVIKQGYTRLLKSLGSNIAEFLANLNNLHLHLTMGFPSMVAPAFRVEKVTSTSLLLHYHSIRPALWPIVSGVLKGASKVLFDHEVEMEVVASREAGDCDHEIFKVTYPHQEALSHWDDHDAALSSEFAMTKDFFYDLFPFHILLDRDCCVIQAGRVMSRLFGETLTRGSSLSDTFKLRHPYIPLEYDKMALESSSLYLLKALKTGLEFKGQMVPTTMPDGRAVLLFLGSPRIATLEELNLHGLYLSDIPLHDMSRDFVLLAEQRQAEADLKERFETLAVDLRVANERLEQATRWLDEERQRSDALLYRMLPADIAADLREGRKVEAISYQEVTILFSDMVGFTTTSAKSTPEEVYDMLNVMYDKFDGLVDDFPDIYKLETIGDAYFLVCNLTTECHNHVDTVIDFAIRMQEAARHVKNAQGEPVQIRIGIHTGPVVGGVLGAKTPRFSIYGDTVNVASRMESHGLPGKIHISDASYNRIVDKTKYAVRERGNIEVKGRGKMTTYLIGGTNDDWLLRHTSFDAQIDGVSKDGSFIITGSGRSLESMGHSRQLNNNIMEAIKEGEEGERPAKFADSPEPPSVPAYLRAGGLGSGTSQRNSNSAGRMGVLVAQGNNSSLLGHGIASSGARGSSSQLAALSGTGILAPHIGDGGGSGSGLRSTTGEEPLVGGPAGPPQALFAALGSTGGGTGGEGSLPLSAAGPRVAPSPLPVHPFPGHVSSGSFRDAGGSGGGGSGLPPIGREGSTSLLPRENSIMQVVRENSLMHVARENSLMQVARENSAAMVAAEGGGRPPVGRDTSFRTVYARGGRPQAPSPLLSSRGPSRKAVVGAPVSNADGGDVVPLGTGGSAGGFPSGGGSFIATAAAPYEPSPLSGGSASMPSGFVKARSATAKASPLAVSNAAGAQMGPAGAAGVTAVAEPGPMAAAPAAQQDGSSHGQAVPALQVLSLQNSSPGRGSSPGFIGGPPSAGIFPESGRPSEMGASVVTTDGSSATPTGKAKGLAGKIKSLFKK